MMSRPLLRDDQKAVLSDLIERELVPLRRMEARYEGLRGAIRPESEFPNVFTDFEPLLARTRIEIERLTSLKQVLGLDLELDPSAEPALGMAAVG